MDVAIRFIAAIIVTAVGVLMVVGALMEPGEQPLLAFSGGIIAGFGLISIIRATA